MRSPSVGATHAGKPVILIITEHTVSVVHRGPGQILATNTIDPDHTYWRNNDKQPGRWPSPPTPP